MATTRIEKYRNYRRNIAASSNNVHILKNPSINENFAAEMVFFKKISFKNHVINLVITLIIVFLISL